MAAKPDFVQCAQSPSRTVPNLIHMFSDNSFGYIFEKTIDFRFGCPASPTDKNDVFS